MDITTERIDAADESGEIQLILKRAELLSSLTFNTEDGESVEGLSHYELEDGTKLNRISDKEF